MAVAVEGAEEEEEAVEEGEGEEASHLNHSIQLLSITNKWLLLTPVLQTVPVSNTRNRT